MIFSSIPFLYYFLPLVLLVYFLTPWRGKNAVLLIASLIFYGWGEPKLLGLMVLTIASSSGAAGVFSHALAGEECSPADCQPDFLRLGRAEAAGADGAHHCPVLRLRSGHWPLRNEAVEENLAGSVRGLRRGSAGSV